MKIYFFNVILSLVLAVAPHPLYAAEGEYLVHNGEIYVVEESIGGGGFGTIYRVTSVRTGKEYAYKEYDGKVLKSTDFVIEENILSTLRELSAAGIDRIVSIVSVGTFEHHGAVAMRVTETGTEVELNRASFSANGALIELASTDISKIKDQFLIAGKTNFLDLNKRIDKNIKLLESIAGAVIQLGIRHRAHRDIKPPNLLVMKDGSAKLGDVDMASRRAVSFFSRSYLPIGTPFYSAPEFFQTGKSDFRSDLYSLGITMAELIIGENPTYAILSQKKPGKEITTADVVANMRNTQDTNEIADYVNQKFVEIRNQILDPVLLAQFSELAGRVRLLLSFQPKARIRGVQKTWNTPYFPDEAVPFILHSANDRFELKGPTVKLQQTTVPDVPHLLKSCREQVKNSRAQLGQGVR